MEFSEVLRRRRMVRNYAPEPVDPAVLERVLRNAQRAPSAGNSRGWAFLVLDTAQDVARYWRSTAGDRVEDPDRWLRGMMTAPVIVVPLSHKAAYLDRYAEPDKGWTDRDEGRWPVPYWHLDAGMAALLMHLTCVDEGLGSCFFGIPPAALAGFREEFGVPASYTPVGALTLGRRAGDAGARGSAGPRATHDVVHRGHW